MQGIRENFYTDEEIRECLKEALSVNLKDDKKKQDFLASVDIIIAEYREFLKKVGSL